MTEKELTAIEARATAATREPWSVSDTFVPSALLSAVSVYGMGMEVAECQMGADGAFIAAARVDVPALIAEVRNLRAERDALRDQWSDLLIEQARLMVLRDDAVAERDALRNVAAFFRSVILSGEQWSDHCQEQYDAALAVQP